MDSLCFLRIETCMNYKQLNKSDICYNPNLCFKSFYPLLNLETLKWQGKKKEKEALLRVLALSPAVKLYIHM